MKKFCLLLLVNVLFGVVGLFAQLRPEKHYLTCWGEGGGGFLLNNHVGTKNGGVFDYAVGVGYEWQRRKFILHTGLEFQRFGGVLRTEPFMHEVPMMDTENDEFTGRFYFQENKDAYSLGYVNLPLMVGGQFGRFYCLGGCSLGVNVFGSSLVENKIKSTGYYEEFIGEFEDMPNHGFTTREVTANYRVDMKVNVALSMELGYCIIPSDEKPLWSYRVGLFADYGLLNIHKGTYSEPLILELSGAEYYWPVQNSLLRTTAWSGEKLHPLSVGVKFTVLFSFPEKYDCHCEWY